MKKEIEAALDEAFAFGMQCSQGYIVGLAKMKSKVTMSEGDEEAKRVRDSWHKGGRDGIMHRLMPHLDDAALFCPDEKTGPVATGFIYAPYVPECFKDKTDSEASPRPWKMGTGYEQEEPGVYLEDAAGRIILAPNDIDLSEANAKLIVEAVNSELACGVISSEITIMCPRCARLVPTNTLRLRANTRQVVCKECYEIMDDNDACHGDPA